MAKEKRYAKKRGKARTALPRFSFLLRLWLRSSYVGDELPNLIHQGQASQALLALESRRGL